MHIKKWTLYFKNNNTYKRNSCLGNLLLTYFEYVYEKVKITVILQLKHLTYMVTLVYLHTIHITYKELQPLKFVCPIATDFYSQTKIATCLKTTILIFE